MQPFRSICLLLLCLVVFEAHAAPVPTDVTGARRGRAFDIALEVSTRQHAGSAPLGAACRVGHRVRACTDFPKEVLECDCAWRGDGWGMEGRAKVDAVIHVNGRQPIGDVLIHERAHLLDVESRLRAHLAMLAGKRFESKASCVAFATVVDRTSYLRTVMNRLRTESNEKFGCDRKSNW